MPDAARQKKHLTATLVLCCLAQFMVILDVSVVNGQRAEAVDQPLVQVLVQPECCHEPAERDVLDDDPRDQEVGIGAVAGADRAAEHVAEQQHEHDRLHGERQQQVGRARQPHQVALGDDHRVGHQAAHQSASSSGAGSSATCPVSVRNTSSSVGWRSARSLTPTPAALSACTAVTIVPLRWATLTFT